MIYLYIYKALSSKYLEVKNFHSMIYRFLKQNSLNIFFFVSLNLLRPSEKSN
jgi:hypothetical protein